MSGYRRVNYFELCRLCTSSEGTKMHIFREEGRRRQLPTKIQICLPLQVCEDDSLPKIICNHCVDKLESFYDFRESCVNAEAMLEGYFTSLRYSDDFTREGKVYVKDESPDKKAKKKGSVEYSKTTVKVAAVQPVPAVPVSVDSLNNLVQATAIQIMQPATLVDTAGDNRYGYQTCATTNSSSSLLMKSEGGTQTEFTNHKSSVKQHDPLQQNGSASSEEGDVEPDGLQQALTFTTTGTAQDVLVQFGFNKEKENSNTTMFRTDDSLQRTSIAQIGEFLRMKTVNLVESGLEEASSASRQTCEHCCKQLNTPEIVANHHLSCPAVTSDEKNSRNFSCDVCAKPFTRKEHLFQHRKLHTGERPYVCGTCGKAFSRKEHLVRHAVSHTGQKIHACDMCTKTFSRKDNLHKHRKTHGIAGPYVCETCGKSFVVKHYYLMHKASHGPPDSPDDPLPYRCDICNKGFSVKQYLATHKLRHRNKAIDNSNNEQAEGVNNQETSETLSLTTMNTTGTLLPPNVLHQASSTTASNTSPLFQVTSGTTTAYLCAPSTVAANQLLETYRRLHST